MKLSKVMAVVVLGSSALVHAAQENGPAVGQPSPNIIGRTLSDDSWRLKNDLGKPKVINFFWVGCKPCKLEMPELAKLEKLHPNVKFISVHSQEEPVDTVVKFVNSLSAAPSNIIMTSGGVQESFRYMGLPHTIVLDKNNVVQMNISGYTPENMQRLSKALQQFN